jgi:DNA-directed RNA polymerase specialized sigma24 family protein
MAIESMGAALRQMNRLFTNGTVAGLGDSQLLERFVAEQDSAAFEVLVTRHGPMVLSICRSVLRDPNDAEDAFQATFLVLAKKAATIRAHAAIGGWLHLVARRIALEANAVSARRRAHERQAGLMAGGTSASATTACDELLKALHDEIARLPEK